MTEQQTRPAASGRADIEARSLLLMPVMEGHKLESDDISSFLDMRLSVNEDDSDEKHYSRLS